MSSGEQTEPNRARLCLGIGAAGFDGFLLALWGLATKGLGSEQPQLGHYGLLLSIVGIGYLALARASPRSERRLRFSKAGMLLIAAFSLLSVLQFSLGVHLFEYQSARLSVSALLRNSSLVFAAVLCHLAWIWPTLIPTKRIDRKAFLGILLFAIACWLYVGLPRDASTWRAALSIWGLLSLWIGFNRALTEILTHAMTRYSDRFNMNLGLGVWHLVFGSLVLGIGGLRETVSTGTTWHALSIQGWLCLFAVAVIIPLAQGFRFVSLAVLNDVVGKKGISIWMFLCSSMLFATLLLGEPANLFMVLGLTLALFAVLLLEPGLYAALIPGTKRIFRL